MKCKGCNEELADQKTICEFCIQYHCDDCGERGANFWRDEWGEPLICYACLQKRRASEQGKQDEIGEGA